ncbi:MAG: hypothetical protein QXM08_04430 [Thermofilaceae archaeon]
MSEAVSMHSAIDEYKRYVAVFYLRRRWKQRYFHADPVLRRYSWYIAYFRITSGEILGKAWRINYAPEGFNKNVVNDGAVQLVLPAHDPGYYVDFAKELNAEVLYYRRKIRLPTLGSSVRVKVPVIVFNSDSHGHLHMLFSTVLATYRNPSAAWRRVASIILRESSWCDTLGVIAWGRFVDVRGSSYLRKGLNYVLAVGRAFRAMYMLS